MVQENSAGCDRPAGGPAVEEEVTVVKEEKKQGETAMIRVGMKAPDFTAPAYYRGKFTQVKLSDSIGKWVVVCFYPGDFTFV